MPRKGTSGVPVVRVPRLALLLLVRVGGREFALELGLVDAARLGGLLRAPHRAADAQERQDQQRDRDRDEDDDRQHAPYPTGSRRSTLSARPATALSCVAHTTTAFES